VLGDELTQSSLRIFWLIFRMLNLY
jgi:hypothetical protein